MAAARAVPPLPRVICANCGRAYEGASLQECPRCHYRPGGPAPSVAPTRMPRAAPVGTASSFSLTPPPPAPTPMQPVAPVKQGNNGFAVSALVLGVLGLLLFPLSILALVLGIVGYAQTRRSGQPGSGLAIAGAVLGALVLGIVLIVMLTLYGLFAS